MSNIIITQTPLEETKAIKVKFTGNQASEMTKTIWKWVDRSESPAVLVLPPYEKLNAQPNENTIEVLDYGSMGDISSAGNHVAVEWFEHDEATEPAFMLFEFDGNKPAQAFSKRLHRKKHQVLIAGDDCVRVVKINPSTTPATGPVVGQRSAAPNGVICVGQELTEGELNYYASLPSDSYNALVGHLKSGYRRAMRAARPMPTINEPVTQTEVDPQN